MWEDVRALLLFPPLFFFLFLSFSVVFDTTVVLVVRLFSHGGPI